MNTIQQLGYGILSGVFVLIIMVASFPFLKPIIIKYMEGRKNVQKEKEIRRSRSSSSNTDDKNTNGGDNTTGIPGTEDDISEQQHNSNDDEDSETIGEYKSLFN